MLESNLHKDSMVYVDNADMSETKAFLKVIAQDSKYQLQSKYYGKVVLIKVKP